jgi:hypothetical protein
MASTRFKLTPDEIAELKKPVNGAGGYQTLLKNLAPLITKSGNITVDDETLGKIIRMCAYGSGGFQGRLRAAFRRSVRDLLAW